jgi:hypothetical protein
MTARSMLPEKPPSKVRHSWRCVPRGPTTEVVTTDATGRARVVEQCRTCGGTDIEEHRLRVEREEQST